MKDTHRYCDEQKGSGYMKTNSQPPIESMMRGGAYWSTHHFQKGAGWLGDLGHAAVDGLSIAAEGATDAVGAVAVHRCRRGRTATRGCQLFARQDRWAMIYLSIIIVMYTRKYSGLVVVVISFDLKLKTILRNGLIPCIVFSKGCVSGTCATIRSSTLTPAFSKFVLVPPLAA